MKRYNYKTKNHYQSKIIGTRTPEDETLSAVEIDKQSWFHKSNF